MTRFLSCPTTRTRDSSPDLICIIVDVSAEHQQSAAGCLRCHAHEQPKVFSSQLHEFILVMLQICWWETWTSSLAKCNSKSWNSSPLEAHHTGEPLEKNNFSMLAMMASAGI